MDVGIVVGLVVRRRISRTDGCFVADAGALTLVVVLWLATFAGLWNFFFTSEGCDVTTTSAARKGGRCSFLVGRLRMKSGIRNLEVIGEVSAK